VKGDVGPYLNDDGDIWVPRTVPYLEAHREAKSIVDMWTDRLVYVGKSDDFLLGFTHDCFCEDYCERARRCDETTGWQEVESGDTSCRVPAWHFRSVER
jgi:hypothetical protein